jgi:hypothetical protein
MNCVASNMEVKSFSGLAKIVFGQVRRAFIKSEKPALQLTVSISVIAYLISQI